ncbi:ATP-binding protein [Actinokineospora soli]|uniref:ATP-binding protein n=1 Tax=Actinokineospora soli TaxID=1048753 RepID=A0ABW2THA3_9PSEU
MDNVEHLRGVGEVVADLLDRLPGAVVLATGRAPLRVPGEQEWPLRPLPVPDGPADLLGSPAAALLVERIRSTVPDFAVTAGNAGLLTEVCRLVDGLPLALELAAAQWRVRGGDAVLRAIRDDPLGLGDADRATPDHASLHSALAATCALLSSTQRDTLRCLAAFRGGWTLDAATAVAPGASTVDDLDRLLALGLVQAAETPTGRRFSMLPTIHALADREAREHRLASASARRHADWMLGWVRELALTSATVPAAVPALDAERDNLRAALSWFDREEPARGLDLALGLYLYWNHQGHHAEGLGWYERLVDRSDDVDARTNALWKSAWLARGLDRLADAETHAARALAESERSADPELRIKALLALGNVIELRRPGSGVDLHRQALAAAERIGARVQVVIAVVHLATTLVDLGDCDEAIRLLRGIEADDLPYQRMGALLNLANALNLRGDHADADAVLLACEPLVAERPGDAMTYWRAQRAHARLGVGDADTARDLARLALADDEDDENRHTKEAWLACGDVALADGRADDAEYAYRRVLTGGFHLASPPGRGLVLTGLALACADARTAAAALATVEDLEHQGFAPPPVVRARAAAAHERWRAAAGWADLVADARRHRVDVVATLTGRESR